MTKKVRKRNVSKSNERLNACAELLYEHQDELQQILSVLVKNGIASELEEQEVAQQESCRKKVDAFLDLVKKKEEVGYKAFKTAVKQLNNKELTKELEPNLNSETEENSDKSSSSESDNEENTQNTFSEGDRKYTDNQFSEVQHDERTKKKFSKKSKKSRTL